MTTAMKRAVALAGGPLRLAPKLIGRNGKALTRQAVEQWDVVPPKHVLKLEELTGISRHQLRPDIYGPEPKRRPLASRRKPEPRVAA